MKCRATRFACSQAIRFTFATRSSLGASLILGLFATGSALASGFAIPELSVAGLGSANALVANPDDTGAFAYNPAAMAFHQNLSISAGGLFIGPNLSLRNATGKHDSQNADWFVAPTIQAAAPINDQWRAGFGVTAPFGLESRWSTGDFPALTGATTLPPPLGVAPVSPQPTETKLEIIDFTPSVAYKVNDQFSLSAGADLYWLKSAALNSSLTELTGDGTGWGFNLGAMYRADRWSLGANFHSSSTVDVTGDYRPLNQSLVALYAATGGLRGLASAQGAELDLHLPWRLQVGARYKLTPELAVELDWTHMAWSEFDTITVTGNAAGQTLLEDQNHWRDTNAFRLGLSYQLTPATLLRCGYAHEDAAPSERYFSARVPDHDRHQLSVGMAHQFSGGWQIDAGYMLVLIEDRHYSGARPYDPLTAPGEINGATALAGDYEGNAHLVGISLTKTF